MKSEGCSGKAGKTEAERREEITKFSEVEYLLEMSKKQVCFCRKVGHKQVLKCIKTKHKFPLTQMHLMTTDTSVNYFENGSRRVQRVSRLQCKKEQPFENMKK